VADPCSDLCASVGVDYQKIKDLVQRSYSQIGDNLGTNIRNFRRQPSFTVSSARNPKNGKVRPQHGHLPAHQRKCNLEFSVSDLSNGLPLTQNVICVELTPSKRTFGLICLALGLITFALYLPALRFDFLSYDDQQYVTENRYVQNGLTSKGFVWAFGFHAGNWHPLTWLSHMLDCQLYSLHPAGHHLTNVLLHTTNTLLLCLFLRRMTGSLWPAAIVSALFGWHPLHVESVAWVAERKDVLSAFFFMLTLLAYVKYVARRNKVQTPKSKVQCPILWYVIAISFFAFGLMSKPMVVTLPFVLLLLDYWPGQRFQSPITDYRLLGHLFVEKVPYLALTAIACIPTYLAQKQADAVASTAGLPISTRVTHAILSYAHYIDATVWPRHLAVYYPYETAFPSIQIIAAALVLAIVSIAAICFARKLPFLIVGWFWFLGTLVPVIGLVQVGEQAWADRYMYLPSIGLFLAVSWGIANWVGTRSHGAVRKPRPAIVDKVGRDRQPRLGVLTASGALGIILAVILVAATSFQLRFWKNTRTLFAHTAAVTPNNYLALTLLGSLDAKEGKLDQAIEQYNKALNWKPDYPEAHFFLANALDQQGKLDAAILEYQKALSYKPIQEQTHIFLGAALAKKRQDKQAVEHYLAALALNPESAVAHNNLAKVLQAEGKLDEAMEHYSAALKFDPSLAQAHNNLGVLLLGRQRIEEGIRELREALRLSPDDLETQFNLALALDQDRQWSKAADLLAKVLEKRGNDPKAHYELALALVHLQRTREAMNHFASALLLNPDFPDALDGLSWILATAENPALRNGPEAVRMAERACELTAHQEPQMLKTLAAAYAECGRFDQAVSVIRTVIGMASSPANPDTQKMLETFNAKQPWRDPDIK
jgi:protein O-mannosyl-transferase